MQKAETVLTILSEKSKQYPNYKFDRIYRLLFNPDMYLRAYAKIYPKEGNMTPGIDGETIDGFNLETVATVIEQLKQERFYPHPVRRIYIPKKKGGQRPLGIPSVKPDKLIQEVVRSILEAIYEPIFSDYSHGFRQNKSCHTALHQIKTTCRGTVWALEGDIKSFYDNVNHEILLQLIRKKIEDGRFIELIRRFLTAGYMEFQEVHESFSGTPQGSIVSPILANIYLHELDMYVEKLMEEYNEGDRRRDNPDYTKVARDRQESLYLGLKKRAKRCLQKMRQLPSKDPFDRHYIRAKYCRYADDWLIMVIGEKYLVMEIRDRIERFLRYNLKLELSEEKTLITNLGEKNVRFLGYEISRSRANAQITTCTRGIRRRASNETIKLLVPSEVITQKLKPFTNNNKSVHHNARITMSVLDIIAQYNAEIRGLYNYYALATDVSTKIGTFKFYHYFSLAKTIARKEKSSVKKVIEKYGVEIPRKQQTGTRKIIGIEYETKAGKKTLTYFNEPLKKIDEPLTNVEDRPLVKTNRCQLIDRLNKNECELCGKTGEPQEFQVHHVRKLKDIKKKHAKRGKQIPQWVLQMSSMNRKTLIVCKKCHKQIHSSNSDC
jgi:group II intron reverse transcriptase/maturase